MPLDPQKLPTKLIGLIPMAEKWGIGDDYEREAAVKGATVEELKELMHCTDGISDDDLYGWLGGAESFNPHPSAEYLALTNLTMAMDSARTKLKRRTE